MNRPIKIILYVVFLAMAVGFGLAAKTNFRAATGNEQARVQKLDDASATEITNTAALDNTNTAVLANTNADASRNTKVAPVQKLATAGGSSQTYSKMVSYGLLSALGFIGFAFLLARDVSHFVANKAEQALFADDGAPADPEYDQTEELWKDGKYLEALNAMRGYLQKHPREQYVSIRIAEIYEENLNNPLAAALEYEEVLKKNLPPERWGWAAIHLANIYSGKLNQPDKAIALLRRIDSEFGKTSAANKARQRLIQIDPNFIPAAAAAVPVEGDTTVTRPVSNLPPGFRPK